MAVTCARGIDVYSEVVGGAVFDAVLPLLNGKRVDNTGAFIKAGKALFVLGNQDRLETDIAVARIIHTHGAPVGDNGCAAGAVAFIGLLGGLAWPGR